MDINKLREEISKRAAAYEKESPRDAGPKVVPFAPEPATALAPPPPMRPGGAQAGGARAFHDTLRSRVTSIEGRLKPVEQIELIHDVPDGHCTIEQVGYQGDEMMVFTGHLASGRRCTVFVHLHAVNLCVTVGTLPAGESRTPIAFKGDGAHDL